MKQNIYLFFSIVLLVLLAMFVITNFNFTGRAVSYVNITIVSMASLNFTVNSINFGAGSVDFGKSNATIDTLGNVINGNWTPISTKFIIENMGNTNLSIFLSSGETAQTLLGGTNPGYYYQVRNYESNSCLNQKIPFNSWRPVNNTDSGDNLCSLMSFSDDNDSLSIDLMLVIPSDSLIGERTDVFTAVGIARE
jgi:hypothetical protein